MAAKRPDGGLEHEIMTVLWGTADALSPSDVRERLGGDLAYTTVATVLGRLHTKGLVVRSEHGKGFRYRAGVDEAQLAATKMRAVLSGASNRADVLSGFVSGLSKRDANALRKLLDGSP